jgi:hypothetical protein
VIGIKKNAAWTFFILRISNVKILSYILLLFFSRSVIAQEPVLIKNGKSFVPELVERFLHTLNNQNDYVISFRVKFTDRTDEKSDYFVLARNGMKLSAFNYEEKSRKLDSLKLSDESLQLVWDTFIHNDLYSMKNETDVSVFCSGKYRIYNSITYEFVLLTKGEMKKLSYYDPERQKIINSVAVITHVLTQ